MTYGIDEDTWLAAHLQYHIGPLVSSPPGMLARIKTFLLYSSSKKKENFQHHWEWSERMRLKLVSPPQNKHWSYLPQSSKAVSSGAVIKSVIRHTSNADKRSLGPDNGGHHGSGGGVSPRERPLPMSRRTSGECGVHRLVTAKELEQKMNRNL